MDILDSLRQWFGISKSGKRWRGHRMNAYDTRNVSSSTYAGAERNRLVSDWVHSSNSADNEIRYSLKTLRNRSRYLYRNDEYARSIINTLVNNVVGTGVQFQSQIKKKTIDELNQKLNDAIEHEWRQWGFSQHCDVSDQRSWCDLQRQILRSMLVDGEILVRLVRREFGNSGIPLAIELIEADQLAEEEIAEYNGNEVRMGVEVDKFHRPVAYHVYEKHPYDTYFSRSEATRKKIRIPAEDIIHVYHPDRTYQTRGIPHLTPSILRMRHLGEYQYNELIASRFGSAVMGLVEQDADAQTDITADFLERIEGGSIRYLAPGEKFQGFAPNRPNTAYSGFVEAQLRALAVGNFLTYEQVSGDYSKVNYSSARVAQLEVRDNFREATPPFICPMVTGGCINGACSYFMGRFQ